ncbi:hypothetical protein J2S03_000542 [Alicyclobacillus cycloheptanicus]|uniref:Uncharacterized protein n=1 Tax=Alicyclobacillus cycloheptanicus TaxID=1457 RepID=A0ABT9XEN2_9BACL|nr:hypothetical protein [Alicyclobacillus cycloheptanicus]
MTPRLTLESALDYTSVSMSNGREEMGASKYVILRFVISVR